MTNEQRDDIDNVDTFTLKHDVAMATEAIHQRKSRERVEAMIDDHDLLERAQARVSAITQQIYREMAALKAEREADTQSQQGH